MGGRTAYPWVFYTQKSLFMHRIIDFTSMFRPVGRFYKVVKTFDKRRQL